MIEDPVIKSWAIAAQSTQAMLFHVPTENMRRIFRYIEMLKAERDRLLEALDEIAEQDGNHSVDRCDCTPAELLAEARAIARAALKGETK